MNKLILASIFAVAPLTLATATESLTDKTTSTLETAGRKTLDAGRAVVNGSEKAAAAAIDAVTPDADARKVEVTLTESRLEMQRRLEAGKTGFMVHNASKESRGFEIQGEGIDKKFMLSIPPNETRVLHVDLRRGSYKAFCPEPGAGEKGFSAELSVK